MSASEQDYLMMFGNINESRRILTMPRCACVVCNACTCACSCRCSDEDAIEW